VDLRLFAVVRYLFWAVPASFLYTQQLVFVLVLVTTFRLGRPEYRLTLLAGAKILLFSLFPRPPLGLIQPPIPVGVGLSSGVKRAGPGK
jgi:hypothetical protein